MYQLTEEEEFVSFGTGSGAFKHVWIKFLPSGFVTIGCNFGVVKVYTNPVSETISNKTWVPVNVDSSYAYII